MPKNEKTKLITEPGARNFIAMAEMVAAEG